MKQIITVLALLSFSAGLLAQSEVTREQADEIVNNYIADEAIRTDCLLIYTTDYLPDEEGVSTITNSSNETFSVEYPCWVYYLNEWTDVNGPYFRRYLFVNKATGNMLEIKTGNDFGPLNMDNWRLINPYLNAFNAEKAEWTYFYRTSSSEEETVRKTVISGDTLIDGTKWRIITGEPMVEKGLIRTDGQKVLFKLYPGYPVPPNMDYTVAESTVIYDFSLEAGDGVMFYRGGGTVILETDSVMLMDGKKHKRLKYEDGRYFIEGLGSATASPLSLFHPRTRCSDEHSRCIDEFEYNLICCQVNDGLLYLNPDFADCDGTPVANETVSAAPQKSGISFDGELLHVTFGGDAPFDVTVYSMQGVMIKQQKASRHEATIPVHNLTQGAYIVQITSGLYSHTRKFITN
jgi:hypothetical protein